MSWLRVDDGFVEHPKVIDLSDRAFRLHVAGMSFCARNLTDGVLVKRSVSVVCALTSATRKHVDELVAAGLWVESEVGFAIKDFLEYNPSSERVKSERTAAQRRMQLTRDPALRAALRARDGDRCRYCGVNVRWNDRRGPAGATYDHVVPDGGDDIENLVVSCRGCNSKKGRRTPSEAGMTLLPPPLHLDADLDAFTPDPDQALPQVVEVPTFVPPEQTRASVAALVESSLGSGSPDAALAAALQPTRCGVDVLIDLLPSNEVAKNTRGVLERKFAQLPPHFIDLAREELLAAGDDVRSRVRYLNGIADRMILERDRRPTPADERDAWIAANADHPDATEVIDHHFDDVDPIERQTLHELAEQLHNASGQKGARAA